tara:strand:+ start:16815 stop:17669 length:855 start_codon:yes stop_codon:yes gene_type:complete
MKKGFTLFEILLVVAIIGIMAALVPVAYVRLFTDTSVDTAIKTYKTTVRRAQTLALSGEGGDGWGVYITTGSATIFKGGSYAGRDTSFDEVYETSGSVVVSGIQEVTFEKITGSASGTGATIFSPSIGDPQSVTINSKGVFRDEKEAVTEQSEQFFIDTSTVSIGPPGRRRVINIDLENNGTATATIETVTLTWSRASRVIQELVFGGTTVWSSSGVGTPTGTQSSGTQLDIVDYEVPSGGDIDVDYIQYNACMRGTDFTMVLNFDDGSATSTSFSTSGGCGGK